MLLHEAVKAARKELSLSQKKLAELAGIQRRQLATLESGGNVTLATVRKVIAQLPNLQSFTLDSIRVTTSAGPALKAAEDLLWKATALYSAAMAKLAERLHEGVYPSGEDMAALRKAHEVLEAAMQTESLAQAIEMREKGPEKE